jgi:hypothetical protein
VKYTERNLSAIYKRLQRIILGTLVPAHARFPDDVRISYLLEHSLASASTIGLLIEGIPRTQRKPKTKRENTPT